MKTKILALIALLQIILGCSGSPPDPFAYSDNTRIILEGKLVDENYAILPKQLIQLFGSDGTFLHQTSTDKNGDFYLSSPKGKYATYILFANKNVSATTNHSDLIKQFQSVGLGYLTGTYYHFNTIVLIN